MDFEIIGNIEAIETIAVGSSIRVLDYLQKVHRRGRWRKLKGLVSVILNTGTNCAFAQWDSAGDESSPQHMKVG